VDLHESPIAFDELDVVIWATGFDFGTGALSRMGIVGRDGRELTQHWADGPETFLGVVTAGFPNFYFPGRTARGGGQQPAVQRRPGRLRHRGDGATRVPTASTSSRSTPEAEARWTQMIDTSAAQTSPFGELGQYFGTNIPGKPRRYLLNAGGRPKLFKEIARVKNTNYAAFRFS